MDILVSRTLYMSCQAGPGIEPGPSALKASVLPIELTWQTLKLNMSSVYQAHMYEYMRIHINLQYIHNDITKHNQPDAPLTNVN